MLGIYLCIFMAARHQLQFMEVKAVHGGKSRSTLQKEVQAAKSLAIIVGLFAVCWLPLHIINCFTLFCPKCAGPPVWIMFVAIILSHANSVINPFIYAYRIREFRQTFRRIIRRHILRKQETFESGSSRRNSMRFKADGINFDACTEHSSNSSCESSCRCSSHISTVRGGLVAVSRPPLSVIVSHYPKMGPCPLQALRHIPGGHHHLQYAEQEHDSAGQEVEEEARSAQAESLYDEQERKVSVEESVLESQCW
ncbi:hypothetical protein F7725_012404 [Dissostichus mawsoni]|uniref:Adenosine receptor A2 n=1 Tax=Dissostichus mawsoni TaxID=36200 RepID=A0A7J5YM83_DISMA|nr:hypothetical protein F7725_012404 [Dissostichus mawsoni]